MSDWHKLSEIADAVPVPLLGIDETGRVHLANLAGCAFIGFARHQLLNQAFDVLFRDPVQAREFRSALSQGCVAPHRFVATRGDGSKLRVEATPGSLAGLHGLDRGWIVMLRDCESDAKAQADLSRSIDTVAHEMRSPLASLRGFAELLAREFGDHLDQVGRGYLECLRSNIEHVHEQLERLIELGRIPERELERSRVLANAVFAEVAQELREQLDSRAISLQLPADPLTVYANRQRFAQVVLNLVVNGVQHMGPVENPEIRIDLKPIDGGHLLVVADNGLGLPPDEHLRIFDLFRSASFGESPRSGGLGLSIVKRIVASHGGWIELDSAPEQGAVFKAFFPYPA